MQLKRFDQVIGHSAAIERLRRDISGMRLPHTYLFVGPDGVGKATVARLMGIGLLCESENPSDRPCGECRACLKAGRSNHPDFHVLEPDKSKRWIRIDQVRKLQADLALKPYEAEWKVALVDRAEALNEAAQNALLKTLEEPPGNALLILVAQSAQNLLPTIVSRSRIERFGPLKKDDLGELLIKQRKLDKDEARLLAGLAGGSVGQALRMDLDFVREERPGLLKKLSELALAEQPGAEDILSAADILSAKSEEGLPAVQSWLRDIAVTKFGGVDIIHSDMKDDLENMAGRWSFREIIGRFQAAASAQEGLAGNFNRALIFENLALALVRGAEGGNF